MSQLGNDLQHNFQLFIDGILASEKVWALKAGDDWVFCESTEFHDTDVVPFWSDKADAQAMCCDEWQGYSVEAIELDRFVEDWLTGMAEDGLLVGPNWNAEMAGLELEPGDLVAQLISQ